jgi:hypothetical protein
MPLEEVEELWRRGRCSSETASKTKDEARKEWRLNKMGFE